MMSDDHRLRVAVALTLLPLFAIAGAIGGGSFWPDVAAIRALQELREDVPCLTLVAIAVTQLGSVWATLGGGLIMSAVLGFKGERRRGLALAALVIGERITLDGLKLLLDRARPALDAHPVATHSSSFPSGHSGNSMAVFLGIALIAVPERMRRRAAAAAVGLAILVGLTRPFLGVHWPSDVIGGWALGAALALTAASFANEPGRAFSDGEKAA